MTHPSTPFVLRDYVGPNAEIHPKTFVTTKLSANEHLPHPKGYEFEACLLPKRFMMFAEKIRHFHVRKDDVWIISFPKTGTTWLQNIVGQLKHGMDFTREPITVTDVQQFLEWPMFEDNEDPELKKKLESLCGNVLKELDETPSPRVIKSHLPPHLLPVELWTVQPKIIYIARNPKDVAISMYHMLRNDFKDFSGTLEEFFDVFLDDNIWYSPFAANILGFWEIRHLDNILFLTYEELSADRFNGVKRISEFLECKYTDGELKQLTEYVSFANMQKMSTKEVLNTDADPNYRCVQRQQ